MRNREGASASFPRFILSIAFVLSPFIIGSFFMEAHKGHMCERCVNRHPKGQDPIGSNIRWKYEKVTYTDEATGAVYTMKPKPSGWLFFSPECLAER